MKKLFFIASMITLLIGSNLNIKNIIGEKTYKTYINLLKPLEAKEDLKEKLIYLKNNGLLKLFFDKPQIIHPTFILKNNNPILETKILYKTLHGLGYYYFYPVNITKNTTYSVTLEMKSAHYIDPVLFIDKISKYGCNVINLDKHENYVYTVECQNAFLPTQQITNEKQRFINANGVYWLAPNGFRNVLIYTSRLDRWYPYITFYDKNLNILNIISKNEITRTLYIQIPQECEYIKITDNFSKENFKRGIYVKGIQ